MIERDDHHLFNDRIAWEARPQGLSMREKLIARNMARCVHNILHVNCSPVPVPLFDTLQWVSPRFHRPKNVFQGIDDVSLLLEQSNKRRSVKPIESEINLLTIESLQDQVPYLLDGMPSTSTVIDLGAL